MFVWDFYCKVFDEWVDGYVFGEGVGVVMFKFLVQVEVDGDIIWVVIKGSYVNVGGKISGYMVFNFSVQVVFIEMVMKCVSVEF